MKRTVFLRGLRLGQRETRLLVCEWKFIMLLSFLTALTDSFGPYTTWLPRHATSVRDVSIAWLEEIEECLRDDGQARNNPVREIFCWVGNIIAWGPSFHYKALSSARTPILELELRLITPGIRSKSSDRITMNNAVESLFDERWLSSQSSESKALAFHWFRSVETRTLESNCHLRSVNSGRSH